MKEENSTDRLINPIKFFTTKRIDLVVGVDYIDYYERKLETDFFRMLYIAHKKSWNDLKDANGKKSEEEFLYEFHKIIKSIKKERKNLEDIPIQKFPNGEYFLGNGFHRVSSLYYYGCDVKYTFCPPRPSFDAPWDPSGCIYYPVNIQWFKTGGYSKQNGLSDCYSNYMMFRFLEGYCKEYSCMVLYPDKQKLPDDIQNEIQSKLIFNLQISYDTNLSTNFVRLLYSLEDWVKNDNYANSKANQCFRNARPGDKFKILFLKQYPKDKLLNLKKRIRDFYKRDNHSAHTTDHMSESINLSHLFNANTVEFLQYTPTLFNNFDSFERCFKNLKSFCKHNKIDTRRICVTSSAVLSVYCLRDCGDIDLLVDKEYVDIFKDSPFDTHNSYANLGHYETTSDDVIYNPQNHFYYDGIKFCILEIIYNYKQYRIQNNLFSEASINKDKADIKLIENSKKFKEKWY